MKRRTERTRRADRSHWALGLSATACLLLYASFPPLNLSLLAWLAPVGWVYLVRQTELSGRRPYRTIWLTAAVFWFVLLEGIGRAFWANYIGLVLLGSYLALYQVVFVALSREAVHRWRMPVMLAAPTIWTGLELVRGHLITGFSMALLGHTQVTMTRLIQCADTFGAYGVSFVVMFVAACFARIVPIQQERRNFWYALPAAAVLAVVFCYGDWRLRSADNSTAKLKVALIQGTEDTEFHSDVEVARQRAVATFNQYWHLTTDVVARHKDLDLIVWPESVFSGTVPELIREGEITPPPGVDLSDEEFEERFREHAEAFHEKVRQAAATFNATPTAGEAARRTYLLVGTDSIHVTGTTQRIYNTALLIDPDGNIAGEYFKMHRVMLGGCVRLGETWPWRYDLVPVGRGVTPGDRPAAFDVHDVRLTPSICFESTVPHLIRRQVRELTARGQTPQMLVNLTNDGWFWGSSILDLQLTCAVFRAIELRRPFAIAANTGLTAAIDHKGRILQILPRRKPGFLTQEFHAASTHSLYERWGDAPALLCLCCCVAAAISGCWRIRRRHAE